jgi:hypothetical protein
MAGRPQNRPAFLFAKIMFDDEIDHHTGEAKTRKSAIGVPSLLNQATEDLPNSVPTPSVEEIDADRTELRERSQLAGQRIRELRTGNFLHDVSIKELIEEGRE